MLAGRVVVELLFYYCFTLPLLFLSTPAEQAIFSEDREACFKWFTQLMTDEPDLDPDVNRNFFENNVLQLDPSLVSNACFSSNAVE